MTCKRIKTCRICLADSLDYDTCNNFIHPCQCIGHLQYVHKQCLDVWRQYQQEYGRDYNSCDICQARFKLKKENYPSFLSHLLILLPIAVLGGLLADQLKCQYFQDLHKLTWMSSFYYAFVTCGLLGAGYTITQIGRIWKQDNSQIIVDFPLINLFWWIFLSDKDDWVSLLFLGLYFYYRGCFLLHEDWRDWRSNYYVNFQNLEILDTCTDLD